jgi:Putative Actinobacterial Holin-X, holin superfamily III
MIEPIRWSRPPLEDPMSATPHVTTSIPASSEQSLGALVAAASRDLSSLIKMEKELAIAELNQTVKRVVPAAIGLVLAAVAGIFVLLIGSMALAYGIGDFLTVGWGFGIVTLAWLLLAAIGGLVGLRSIKKITPPERTIRTVKDTADWARHPTGSSTDVVASTP